MNRRDQIKMSDTEITEFLNGRRTMNIATIGKDGRPHLVAMWYGFLEAAPAFETYAKSQKVINLRRDPRITCLIEEGDMLDLKTGNMAILDDALVNRGAINNFNYANLISYAPNGAEQLNKLDDPNIVVIPIIDAFVNGSHPVKVVNFAYFIITSWTKDNVRGRFVKTGSPGGRECPSTPGGHEPCPIGAYDANGISTVQLVD